MDPLAHLAGSQTNVRPVLSLDSSLTAVLQEGRVVAGEVLQTLDGRSLLIGIGRHRVPADANVDLQPGERFLARVDKGADGVVLKVVGARGAAEPQLLMALRAVVGEDRPIGELLGDLAARLKATADGSGKPDRSSELLQRLAQHVFQPGASGDELSALLSRSGIDFEALLLAETKNGGSAVLMNGALSEFTKELLLRLQQFAQFTVGFSKTDWATLEKGLLADLRALDLVESGLTKSELLSRVGQRVEARLAQLMNPDGGGSTRHAGLEGLGEQLAKILGEEKGTQLAERLARLLSAKQDASALASNLKGELLRALAELPAGEARDAAAKTLAGIESEQLLNLARREFSEGWHLTLPVPDGDRWATAQLFYHDPEDSGGHKGHGSEDMQRMTVAVDFTALGPLRAEIGVRDDLVALRITVTRPEIVERLQGATEVLTERLATGGREARVSIGLGARADTEVDSMGTDIRWLREHHLMDLSG